jgi:hypothetical protein
VNELWATLWRVLRDPRISTALVLGLSVLAGLAMIVGAYWGTAGLGLVVLQMPYVLSGALAGLAVVGAGMGLLSIHFDRVESIEERRDLAQIQTDIMRLVKKVAQQRQA